MKRNQKHMDAGVTFIDSETAYIADDVQIGSGTTVEPFVIIGKNVVIGDNVTIKGFSHLEECIIEKDAIVGPFARVRGGCIVKEKALIGNFVEVKNTVMGMGVKVPHLAFIGDAEIGSNTNVGAGVVTCNYDGFNKFKTILGSDAFIGSNVTIVAPINIGDDTLIGAGSVITKDVGADDLAIARADIVIKKGGAKKYRERKKN